jgi:hypothetical protein
MVGDSFKYKVMCECITMLKAKPIDKFESLILRKRDDIHDFVAATFSANMPTSKRVFSMLWEPNTKPMLRLLHSTWLTISCRR